jgi:hypothetical protein
MDASTESSEVASATRYFFGSVPPSPPSFNHLCIFAIRALAMMPL